MDRPYIICHMLVSKNGKVTGDFLDSEECMSACEDYFEIHRQFKADAFACGRITMEESFTGSEPLNLSEFEGKSVTKSDYIADRDAEFFAVAFDRNGTLPWKSSRIKDDDIGYDNAHIIEVLTEKASESYLAYLKSIGVSYIFAGETDIDIPFALFKLKSFFGIEKLLLEGGSIINGAFKKAGVIDELSLVMTQIRAEETDKPIFFNDSIVSFKFGSVGMTEKKSLWMRYHA